MRTVRWLLPACLAVGLFHPGGPLLSGPQTLAATSEDCLVCHSDNTLTTERRGRQVSLYVDDRLLSASAHAGVECAECHTGVDPENVPHRAGPRSVDCTRCHGDVSDGHGFHPFMAAEGGLEAIACTDCHGRHEISRVDQPESKFSRSSLGGTCGKCHEAEETAFRASAHGESLRAGDASAPDCLTCHRQPLSPGRFEGNTVQLKIVQEKACLHCHLDDPSVRERMGPSAGFIEAYEKSVHDAALLAGNGAAANCVDCHGSHEMKPGFDPTSRVSKEHIPETCGRCHEELAARYSRSVHAAAFRRGDHDAPVCTDCHGEHGIMRHDDPRSPTAPLNVSAQVCSPCHSSLKLSQKYALSSDRFRSFSDSYHGMAIRGGEAEVANCASCHGSHDILPSSDPASSVNKANLAATCGKCHPGSNDLFAVGEVHVTLAESDEPVLYWIATVYVGLIVFVIGGMLLHNALDFAWKARRRYRVRHGHIVEEPADHVLYLRMTVSERIQHAALALSFIILVVTGFMLHYPDAWWVRSIRSLYAQLFETRSLAHRVAGVVLVAVSVFHVFYVAFTARGRRFLLDMLPSRRDVLDPFRAMLHNAGILKRRPRFPRFSYIEKAEYWAVIWGTAVMAITGTVMWFENTFIGLLSKLGYDIARSIHFYEAWLATLAIIAWHFYYVIFNPDSYPLNTAWFTGTLTEEEMIAEHPLELEEIRRARIARSRSSAPEDGEPEGDAGEGAREEVGATRPDDPVRD